MQFNTKSGSTVCSCGKCNTDIKPEFKKVLEDADHLFVVNGLGEMVITSGARCHEYNMTVGGLSGDAHEQGLAVDIICDNSENRYRMIRLLMEYGIRRIGPSKQGFLHWDIAENLPTPRMWLY